MADTMIEVAGVKKAFGTTKALCGVDLTADRAKVLGLLGPNGAGKTTLVRILATLLLPDEGSARIAGLDVVRDADAVRPIIGLAGQYAAVDETLTGRENLELVGASLPPGPARGPPPGRRGPRAASRSPVPPTAR